MQIRVAEPHDLRILMQHDRHIACEELEKKLLLGQVLVMYDGDTFAGWLRWNCFWDEHPFMNLLFLLEEYRGKGHSRALVAEWERMMKENGHTTVMTSTQANECAQFFYRHLGYEDIGAFALPGDPLELILSKAI